jgi:murein DD-endopeptidase MepM/ murein hydrolase activator NlpD
MFVYLPPVEGVITQDPSFYHQAYDFSCIPGDPVRSVRSFKWSHEMGWTYTVKYEDRVTSYSHLGEVGPKTYVLEGDVIGLCGNTGAYSTGPHVHFESNKPYRF